MGSGQLAVELLSWKSGLRRGAACVCTHTLPPPPREAGAQTAPVWTGPSFLRDPAAQGCVLTSCVSRPSLTRSVTLGRALPLRASLSGPPCPICTPGTESQGPLRALASAAGSVVVRISGVSVPWPRFKCRLCLSRCVCSGLLLNLHPCAHLEHGLMTVTMLVMTVMMLLMKVVTPWMEVMVPVVRVMAWC